MIIICPFTRHVFVSFQRYIQRDWFLAVFETRNRSTKIFCRFHRFGIFQAGCWPHRSLTLRGQEYVCAKNKWPRAKWPIPLETFLRMHNKWSYHFFRAYVRSIVPLVSNSQILFQLSFRSQHYFSIKRILYLRFEKPLKSIILNITSKLNETHSKKVNKYDCPLGPWTIPSFSLPLSAYVCIWVFARNRSKSGAINSDDL